MHTPLKIYIIEHWITNYLFNVAFIISFTNERIKLIKLDKFYLHC